MTVFWGTYEIDPGHLLIAFWGATPDIKTSPEFGSKTPRSKSTSVVLPAPEGPTIAVIVPLGIFNDKSVIALDVFSG